MNPEIEDQSTQANLNPHLGLRWDLLAGAGWWKTDGSCRSSRALELSGHTKGHGIGSGKPEVTDSDVSLGALAQVSNVMVCV